MFSSISNAKNGDSPGRARIAAAQRTRWAKVKGENVVSIARGGRRKMSAAAIARIRAAQKARWAKWRKVHKEGLVARVVPIPQHEKHACVAAGLELLSKGLNIAVVLGP